MEEEKIFCKECCREISLEESKQYKGYCKNCNGEKEKNEETTNNNGNKIAEAIKVTGVILCIIGVIAGISVGSSSVLESSLIIGGSIISTILMFGFGEIIQLLEDIRNK